MIEFLSIAYGVEHRNWCFCTFKSSTTLTGLLLAEAIGKALCPPDELMCVSPGYLTCAGDLNDCNGHGDCFKGHCFCHIGYGSPDCTKTVCTGPCPDVRPQQEPLLSSTAAHGTFKPFPCLISSYCPLCACYLINPVASASAWVLWACTNAQRFLVKCEVLSSTRGTALKQCT